MQTKEYIYVLNDDGCPLMPTTRRQHINRLLKTHQAHIVSEVPFTIQLNYHSPGVTQPLHGGTDPGRSNIGEAVIDDRGNVVYMAKLTSSNEKVTKNMTKRREHRQVSRRGERLARKRLAKKHDTLSGKLDNGRILPGCEKPLNIKNIINTEARFNNRKKRCPLTPTVRHLIDTHINMIKKICSILPVTDWTIELNKFAFMELENGQVRGTDFQNGRMKNFPSMNAYVSNLQHGKCLCCDKYIKTYHHIRPKSKGGSDTPENIAGLCLSCHEKVHKGEIDLNKEGLNKKYAGVSVLNQAMPYIIEELKKLFTKEKVYNCNGYETKLLREELHILKDHDKDACVIVANGNNIKGFNFICHSFDIRQYRRHDRANIKAQTERTYYFEGKVICKNRNKRFEQTKIPSLKEIRQQYGENITGKLTVKKSKRRYNKKGRLLPGTVFYYQNERHVVSGSRTNGKYFLATDDTNKKKKNYPVRDCVVISHNTGLVYII